MSLCHLALCFFIKNYDTLIPWGVGIWGTPHFLRVTLPTHYLRMWPYPGLPHGGVAQVGYTSLLRSLKVQISNTLSNTKCSMMLFSTNKKSELKVHSNKIFLKIQCFPSINMWDQMKTMLFHNLYQFSKTSTCGRKRNNEIEGFFSFFLCSQHVPFKFTSGSQYVP